MNYPVKYRRGSPSSTAYDRALRRQQSHRSNLARALRSGKIPQIGRNIYQPSGPRQTAATPFQNAAFRVALRIASQAVKLNPWVRAAYTLYDLYWIFSQIHPNQFRNLGHNGNWVVIGNCGFPNEINERTSGTNCNNLFAINPPGIFYTGPFAGDTQVIFTSFVHRTNPGVSPAIWRRGETWRMDPPESGFWADPPYVPGDAQWPTANPSRGAVRKVDFPASTGTEIENIPGSSMRRAVSEALASLPQGYQTGPQAVSRSTLRGTVHYVPAEIPNTRVTWEIPISPPKPKPESEEGPVRDPRTEEDPGSEPDTPPVIDNPPYRPEPLSRKDEAKHVSRSAGMRGILMIIGSVTEGLDLVSALFKALPKERRRGARTFTQRMLRVIDGIRNNEIPLDSALEEIFWNNVEDLVFGRLGRKQAKAIRKLADRGLWHSPFGATVGGSARQKATEIDGISARSPLDDLREFLEPYYQGDTDG